MLRQATYGTIKFGTYYTLKKFALERGHLIDKHGNERVWCNVICAVIGIYLIIIICDLSLVIYFIFLSYWLHLSNSFFFIKMIIIFAFPI